MTAHAGKQRGTLVAVAAIILGGGVAGILLGRQGADAPLTSVAAAQGTPTPKQPAHTGAAAVAAPAPALPAVAARAAVPALSAAELARLADASMVGPPDGRLAAIQRLSQAPRNQALPLLKRVLLNGDPVSDRPAALRGLRDLAFAQGDGDQRIRDAMREVIYHGDDEAFAADAQATLDSIAASQDSIDRSRRDR